MSQPIILRGLSPAPQLFANALHAAYTLEWPIIDPDWSQQEDLAIWEKIMRDGKISQAMNMRCAKVAAKNWEMQPRGKDEKEKEYARIIKELIEQAKGFRPARKFLAESRFRARAYVFVNGRRRRIKIGDHPAREWWFPTHFRHVDKRSIRFDIKRIQHAGREHVIRIPFIFRDADGKWVKISADDNRRLLQIVYDDEQGRLGYGRGLFESMYFLWWAKGEVWKQGLQAVERWAQGMIVAKVDAEARGSDSSEEARDEMRDEINASRGEHTVVVDKRDEIDVVQGGKEGAEIAMAMLKYIDDCIMSTGLGSVLPFGGGLDKGSMARAETESEESDELIEFDRGVVDEALCRLVDLCVFHNLDNLRSLGYADERVPRFHTEIKKTVNHLEEAQIFQVATQGGARLKVEEVHEKIGYTVPADGDDVYEAPQPQFTDGMNGATERNGQTPTAAAR